MASSARIEELRKKFEENPRRYFAPLANEYRKAGDIEQAIAICREYLPQQPGHMSGHIVYGQALFEARQVEEARTVFETALSLDPENLIALRHLGDLALLVGDAPGARMWYGRVLEADPRNEEIQAQLASLDQSASTAPTPLASASIPGPAPTHPAAPSKPTPSSAPTVVVSAQAKPQPWATPKPVEQQPPPAVTTKTPTPAAVTAQRATPPAVSAQSPTAEISLDALPTASQPAPVQESENVQDMTLGLEPTSVPAPAQSAAAATMEIDVPVSGARASPPLDSFSLEGLETTSMAGNAASASPSLPSASQASPPPPAASYTSAQPAEELALLDIGEIPAASVPSAPAPPASQVPSMSPVLEAPAPEVVPTAPAAPLLEEWTPQPPATPEPLAEPVAEVAAAVHESGPFVTETMAELYLHQGHREEAARVYRALLEQRPGDPTLIAKLAALAPPLQPVAHANAPAGQTIRELLAAIAVRRPASGREAPRENGAAPSASAVSTASPAASESPESPPDLRSELSVSAPGDALAALFAGVQVAQHDEDAATVLAYAFMDLNGLEKGAAASEQIGGAPARHATNELSLDSVFKTEAPPSTAPSSFSFDQFFSQRATAEQPAQSGVPATGSGESRADVVQFTQWLEGLKQR